MKLNNKLNKKYTLISIYVIVTAIIIYCLSLVAKAAPVIFMVIMERVNWLMKVCKPIVLGFVFAYLFEPLNNFFEVRYEKIRIKNWKLKSGRTLAVFTTVILFFLAIVGIISLLVYTVTDQIRVANFDDLSVLTSSLIKTFNDFYNSVINKLADMNIQSQEITNYITSVATPILEYLKNTGTTTISSFGNLSSYITTFLFSLIISIYFMIDGRMIKVYLKKVGKALFNDRFNNKFSTFLADADYIFSGYVRGQMADAFVMMVLISLTLMIAGVKFAIIIGIFAGIGNLIPYCGPFIAYFSTAIVCLINGQYKELIIAVIALVIIQAIDGNVIQPKLLSKSIEIHPVIVIISLIFGSAIGGLMGMLLAVPVGALIKLLFVRFIDHRIQIKEQNNAETDDKDKKSL
ncbi:AI-2E family transporter [Anaerocolumna cellulosilytica]|nr:AI-2E family transporter [Anaerocolumna cellulosilytica]MBB5197979.1 putative PurR-regulated permease PerM [Anaerocolumna cellulosilytica]